MPRPSPKPRRLGSGCGRGRRGVLRVEDATPAVAWYARLGFIKGWEHQFEPGFPFVVSVARGSVRLYAPDCRQARTPAMPPARTTPLRLVRRRCLSTVGTCRRERPAALSVVIDADNLPFAE